ncbi:MAG: DUF4157 domain-containing protein [Nostoc sp.]|uniref:eCIS core domain-containing protein n=1 Tax=Nostoc sp. TaxID=1180 RepID=UPI002FFD1B76
MSDTYGGKLRTFGRNKAGTSNFSNPSLVSPTTPTLANPVRSFGSPTNNVIQTATEESTNLQEAQSADEQSLLSETIPQRSFGHDISRMALRRPQAKLTVGEPGDKYEQEADWVANQVMRMTYPPTPNFQRQVEEEETEEIQTKPLAETITPLVQRQEMLAEEKLIQAKCETCEQEEPIQRAADGVSQVQPDLENRLNASQGGGSALPDEVRSFMEPRLGADFQQVRVHTDSEAVQMNKELKAQAFTYGSDIYFGSGKSPEKNDLTAHELTHVVQQTKDNRLQQKNVINLWSNKETLQPKISPAFSFNSLPEPTIQLKDNPEPQPAGDNKETEIQKAPTALPEKVDRGAISAPTNAPKADVAGKPAIEAQPETMTDAKSDQAVAQATGKTHPTIKPLDGGAPKSSSSKADIGATPVPANTSKVTAEAKPATKASSGGTTEVSSAELTQFIQQAAAKRDGLFQSAEPKKQQILANAEIQKQNVQQSIEAKVTELEKVYSQTLQQVRQAAQNARIEITSQQDVKIEATQNAAQTELGNLQRVVGEKQNAIRQAAESKAIAATTEGNQQAQRAIDGCNNKAVQARTLGESKAAQYSSYKRAPDIASGARQMANKAAEDIINAGKEIATAVHQDANDLAAKFRREGEEAAQKFSEPSQASRSKIEKTRDDTIAAINQAATESLSQIDLSARDTTAQLESGHAQGIQQIHQLAQQALPAIDQSAQNACQQVDENATKFANGIDSFVAEVSAQLGSYPGDLITENINTAETQLNSTLTQYDSTLEQISTGSQSSGQEVGNQAIQQATTLVAQLSAPVQQIGSDFETKVSNITSQTSQKMGDAAAKSVEDMQKVVTDVGNQLQRAVDESTATWERQLNEGKAQFKQKVDDGLAKQDEAASGLGAKIDKMAEEVENESLLERGLKAVGSFLGGIWDGFVELLNVLWQVVKVLLIVALVVLAIVIVVGLIILIVGGAEALLAAIVAVVVAIEAVVAFVASIAAILEVIVAIVTIVFAVVALIAFAIAVYQAFFSGKAMTDDERWRMLGKSFFDLVLALLPLAGSIKTIGRLGRLLGMVEDTGQLLQLLRKVRNVEQLILLLEEVGDAGKLLKLLELPKIANAAELLRLLELPKIANAAELERLLNLPKIANAAELERLLNLPKIANAAELERLLNLPKIANAAELERLLELPKIANAAELERLLELPKIANAAELERLLNLPKIANAAELERLLNLPSMTVAQLEKLLVITDDAAQLERFLTYIDDPLELERLINNAGLKPAPDPDAFRLDRVLDKMGPGKKSVADVEAALDAQKKIDSKILVGEQKGTTPGTADFRTIRGAHSPSILSDPNFRIIDPAPPAIPVPNADGTVQVKFQKLVSPGPPEVWSRTKSSTLAPSSWSDSDILRAGDQVAKTPPVLTRARDGATLHQGIINGAQWEVIKDASGNVTSSYPTGGSLTTSF